MVDPQSPTCALSDSDLGLTRAVYYDVFRIINGTNNFDDTGRISRSDLRRQVKTVRIRQFKPIKHIGLILRYDCTSTLMINIRSFFILPNRILRKQKH